MSPTRLLRLLTIFAMLFGSISMTGGHAAMAMPGNSAATHHAQMADMPAGHCSDRGGDQDQNSKSRPNIDCTIACSIIMASIGGVAEVPPLTTPAHIFLRADGHDGLNPESDPPPPRIS